MKYMLKYLFCGCIALSIANSNISLSTELNIDISEYDASHGYPRCSSGSEGIRYTAEERALIFEICDRWILSKKMYYAGADINKRGWINGCLHKTPGEEIEKFEDWTSSFKAVCQIIADVLTGGTRFCDISQLDYIKDPALINGLWMKKFVIFAFLSIKDKKKTSLNEIKKQVLDSFYNEELLIKDKSALHDMHSYIGTLDVFDMVVTAMRVSMTLKELPNYERSLYETSEKQSVPAIQFGNGYMNCYLTSFFQIINALDSDQIDDAGLRRLQRLLRDYDADFRDGKTLLDSYELLDPRGLFNKEYKKAWNEFSKVVNKLSQNVSIKDDPSIKKLLNFYKSEKSLIDLSRENVYSPYWHISNFYKLKAKLKEEFDEKILSKIMHSDYSNLSAEDKTRVNRTIEETGINPPSNVDDVEKSATNFDIFINATLFNQCDKIFADTKTKTRLDTKYKKVIEKFLQIREIQNLIYSHNSGESIGDAFNKIRNYFDIYSKDITEYVEGFYRQNVNENWIPVSRLKNFDKNTELHSRVNLRTICDKNSGNLLYYYYDQMKDICTSSIKKDTNVEHVMNVDTILNLILYKKDDIFNIGWNENVPDLKNLQTKFKVKKLLNEQLKLNIKKIVPPGKILQDGWWDQIKIALSDKINIVIDSKEYEYKVDADKLLEQLQKLNSFRETDVDIKKRGVVSANEDEINDVIKSSFICAKIKKCPSVMFANYENLTNEFLKKARSLLNKEYLYIIDANSNVSFYRLIGFANHYPGHYNVSVFSGFENKGITYADENGWQTVDGYYNGIGINHNYNYPGKKPILKNVCPALVAWQKIPLN